MKAVITFAVQSSVLGNGCLPEKPQGSLIVKRPFSMVGESGLRVNPRHSPFTVGSNDGPDEPQLRLRRVASARNLYRVLPFARVIPGFGSAS
jgi:hypothetical protein